MDMPMLMWKVIFPWHPYRRWVPQAACLRAVRLGGMSIDDAVETDMRLAAAAYLHGHESNALKIYFGIMGQPFTNENGR